MTNSARRSTNTEKQERSHEKSHDRASAGSTRHSRTTRVGHAVAQPSEDDPLPPPGSSNFEKLNYRLQLSSLAKSEEKVRKELENLTSRSFPHDAADSELAELKHQVEQLKEDNAKIVKVVQAQKQSGYELTVMLRGQNKELQNRITQQDQLIELLKEHIVNLEGKIDRMAKVMGIDP
eukprot:Rmarinus@m.25894